MKVTAHTMGRTMKRLSLLAGILFCFAVSSEAARLGFTDLVGKAAVTSFKAMVEALPDQPVLDGARGFWVLTPPDASAQFVWSAGTDKERPYDAALEFPAEPFLKAGLTAEKLPAGMLAEDKIVVSTRFYAALPPEQRTPEKSFEAVVASNRDLIGYHAELDHYGLGLGDGNVFEWAKNMDNNDKDIVFVLNPQVFIAAGADPTKIEGWTFGKVEIEEASGRKVKVDRLLKPFNLKPFNLK